MPLPLSSGGRSYPFVAAEESVNSVFENDTVTFEVWLVASYQRQSVSGNFQLMNAQYGALTRWL